MRRLVIAFALLCAACATPPEPVTSAPVDVRFANQAAMAGLEGYETVYVRTYLKPPSKPKVEIKNVQCRIQGSNYTAEVTTPGILNLPDYRERSRAVNVTCTKGGITKSAIIEPFNRTSANMMAGSGNGGLIGVIVVAGIDAARNKSNDDWGYRDVSVIFDAQPGDLQAMEQAQE